jgi:hypothetical protein
MDTTSGEDEPEESQIKPPSSSQEQQRHLTKMLTRSKSKDDLKEGSPQGKPADKDSLCASPILKQVRNIVDVRTACDVAMEAIAWRVDPTS